MYSPTQEFSLGRETLRGGWATAAAAVAVLPGDLNAGRAQGTVCRQGWVVGPGDFSGKCLVNF